eukprot:7430443-Pyramimonas_sp.AAC.1
MPTATRPTRQRFRSRDSRRARVGASKPFEVSQGALLERLPVTKGFLALQVPRRALRQRAKRNSGAGWS